MAERKVLLDPEMTNSGLYQASFDDISRRLKFGVLEDNQLGGANLQAQSLVNYAKDSLNQESVQKAMELQKQVQELTANRLGKAMREGKDLAKQFPGITGIDVGKSENEKTKVSISFKDERGKQYALYGKREKTPVDSVSLARNYKTNSKETRIFNRASGKLSDDLEKLQKQQEKQMSKASDIGSLIKKGEDKAAKSAALAGPGIGINNPSVNLGNFGPGVR